MYENKTKTQDSWETYWRGANGQVALTNEGETDPALNIFWEGFFKTVRTDYAVPNIIDIASGNGAVIKIAQKILGKLDFKLTSLDISESAIKNIEKSYPKIRGIVANATKIPYESTSFDIVTSQFGIEYAGIEAILEASRLVSVGGLLVLIMHQRSSIIDRKCSQNYKSIQLLLNSEFIPLSIDMFRTGFNAVSGSDRQPYENAAKKLAPSIKQVEDILNSYGTDTADGTILKLYEDIGNIHKKIQYYDSNEVLEWLTNMKMEINAYSERMLSMTNSALDNSDMAEITSRLEENNFMIEHKENLIGHNNRLPLGWTLVARREPD
ncbi:MAG: class I SAM-dependent methyltransferase [Gammaproteobacteria bacterium]|nr:class I SAM-dependent methyltransferase [Gammaproteobacteria bacterium]MDH5629393.1 class I SAM-dependent methyltransferase [Gammaproteobacteria bacterium]